MLPSACCKNLVNFNERTKRDERENKKNRPLNECRQCVHSKAQKRGRKKDTPFISSQVIDHRQYQYFEIVNIEEC